MKRTLRKKKREKTAAMETVKEREWTDPMSGPVFQNGGIELFKGI